MRSAETDRRAFLRAGAGLAGAAVTAGCLSRLGFTTRSARSPPLVEDRPDAVYYPTHVEGMEMAGSAEAGPYEVALSYSFPHRFWVVTGTNTERVEVRPEDSAHLMVSLRGRETGIVPPTASAGIEVSRAGTTVVEKRPWSMLSQNMGVHLGDNVALSGDGTYDVAVRIDPVGTRRTGAFRGRFGEQASASFSVEFSRSTLRDLPYRRLPDKQGQPGAVEPMGMGQAGRLPAPEALPGRGLGEAESGDGVFAVRALDEPPAGIDAGTYLAVSARTPYNRFPLPSMSLSAAITRGGETVAEGDLLATLDPDLGFHYGLGVESIESGDGIDLAVGAPPQIARHEGYETAFVRMDPMSIEVP